MPTPAPAAVERHPHLAAPLADGLVRVDFHVHTMWSGDATTTPDELAEAVDETGIDVLCITDHHATKGAETLAGTLRCRVVVGEELKTTAGEIIGLFLSERLPFGLKPHEAASRIRQQGGLVYVPHPFDPTRHCLREDALRALVAEGLVDAVEVFNAKTPLASLNGRAAAFAAECELPGGSGSDAHEPTAVGAAYVEMPDFDGPSSFLASLRSASASASADRVVGHAYDRPRTWRPRIVPSTKGS